MSEQEKPQEVNWTDELTAEQRAELLTDLEASHHKEQCESHLAEFVKGAWDQLEPGTPLVWNWHLDTLCAYLEAIDRGDIRRLIINIPPGTMKSLIVSVFFPAWQWTKDPTRKYLCGSNGDTLAERDAVKMRNLVTSDWYLELWGDSVVMDTSVQGKKLFGNMKLGTRQSQGFLGKITGKRADTILLDDVHDAKESESATQREAIIEGWDGAWSSRVNSYTESAIILVMQRVHYKDLTGHLSSKTKQDWKVLAIPMRYDPEITFDAGADIGRPDLNDPRKEEGELLFPQRFPEEAVRDLETDMGPYRAAGQLGQRPSPKTGGEMKKEWLCYYKEKPRGGNRVMIIDPAGEKKKGTKGKRDNTAIGVFEICEDGNYYLIDGYRDRLNLDERMEIIFKLHRKYQPSSVGYEEYGMQSDIASLESKMERDSYRFRVTKLAGKLAKEDRIRRLIPMLSNHRIWLPMELYRTIHTGETIDMIDQFVEREYLPFPVGEFDDFLDMMSRLCDEEMKKKVVKPNHNRKKLKFRQHKIRNRSAGY